MSVQVIAENEIIQEASQILLDHLSPAKAARFWANWQVGKSDYQAWRDEVFSDETVASLYMKIEDFQE